MRDPVVLCFIAAAMVWSLGNSFVSLLFYWWLAIFRPQDWMWGDYTFLRLSLIAGIIALVGCLLRGHFPRIRGVTGALILAFALNFVVATWVNGCDIGWAWVDHYCRLALILFLTDRFLTSPKRITIVLFVVAVSLAFYSSKAGLSSVLGGGLSQYGVKNLGGSFSESNAFALGTAVVIFYLLAVTANPGAILGGRERLASGAESALGRYFRWGMVAACFFSAINIMSLSSRGSFLGLAAGGVVFIATRRNGLRTLAKLLPVALIALLFVPMPEGFTERISSAFVEEEQLDKSAASRFYFWGVGMDMARAHPLGVGANCFNARYNEFDHSGGFYGRNRSVHSAHFQVLAEAGYIGLLIWTFLILSSIRQCLAIKRRALHVSLSPDDSRFLDVTAVALMSATIAFCVGGAFYPAAFMEFPWLTFVVANSLSSLSKTMVAQAANSLPEK
jgi:putative inorganic carbon (hco3(-)) transporter